MKSEAKKRQDAAEAYEKAGRPELAEKEKKELSILKDYLPEEISEEEIEEIAKRALEELQVKSIQDFGKIMKEIMTRTKGQADGKKVGEIVKKLLA